ncbi:hypothetical protein HDK77DRAFT_192927 [Phyllosticta capitalensis]
MTLFATLSSSFRPQRCGEYLVHGRWVTEVELFPDSSNPQQVVTSPSHPNHPSTNYLRDEKRICKSPRNSSSPYLGRLQATPRPIGAHPAPPPSQPNASQRWRSATRPTGTNATQPPNRLRFSVRLLKPPVPKSCLLAFRACAWAWFQLLGWPAGWLALAFRLLSLAGWLGGRRCEG